MYREYRHTYRKHPVYMCDKYQNWWLPGLGVFHCGWSRPIRLATTSYKPVWWGWINGTRGRVGSEHRRVRQSYSCHRTRDSHYRNQQHPPIRTVLSICIVVFHLGPASIKKIRILFIFSFAKRLVPGNDGCVSCECFFQKCYRLAAYLDGGPACASVGALTLRAGLAHVPLGPNSSYIHHTPHNIGQFAINNPKKTKQKNTNLEMQ